MNGIETIDRREAADLAARHRLVGFGAGELGLRTLRFLGGHLSYFVDNAPEKWDAPWEGGLPVRPVATLSEEDPSDLVVVVCTEQLDSAHRQLRALLPTARLVHTPLLRDHDVFDALQTCSTRLLVSAYGADGGLYLLDGRTGQHRSLSRGAFRGLQPVNDRLVVATEQGDLALVRGLDPLELEVRHAANGYCQMHGLAYWPGGHRLFAAEARTDRIAVFDAGTFERVDSLPISPLAAGSPADWHHVNDLLVIGDRLLVSVFSARGWWQYGLYDGAVLETDLRRPDGFRPVITGLCFPHSIRLVGGTLCLLEAMNGNLRLGDAVAMRFPGFVRGLDGSPRCVYVGQSRNRRIREAMTSFNGVSMDSGLYVADLQMKVFRFLKLPDGCDVYDILDLESTEASFDA